MIGRIGDFCRWIPLLPVLLLAPPLAAAQTTPAPEALPASSRSPAPATNLPATPAAPVSNGQQEPAPDQARKDARTSRISDESVPTLDVENYPKRPRPIIELGPKFLGTGNIARGFELPGGAVWTPQLIVFGTYSTALQGALNPVTDVWTREWANRLDLFANLQLSGTERLIVGFRPLDDERGASGYHFTSGVDDRWDDRLNADLRALFFEGDIGQIFPNLDPLDRGRWDIGFAVGRQPLGFQDGILINDDAVDLMGVTRNTILPRGGSNLQFTGLYGWGALHGNNNLERPNAQMFALVTTADLGKSSLNAEVFFVDDQVGQDDGAYWAISRTRRHGHLNTTFRLMGSYALDDIVRPGVPVVDTGHLVFSEISWTPPWTKDLAYVNAFWAIDNFTSVARAPGTGGPLGRAGILFAATGFGRYPAPLSNQASDVAGGALGYQKFLNELGRKQFVLELVGRVSESRAQETALGAGGRYQQAFGRHLVLQFDAYGKYRRDDGGGGGMRVETRIEF